MTPKDYPSENPMELPNELQKKKTPEKIPGGTPVCIAGENPGAILNRSNSISL